jgi:hypothetical protein
LLQFSDCAVRGRRTVGLVHAAKQRLQRMPQAKGYRAKALATAQERLFNAGRIEVVKVGPPSKALDRISRKEMP